MIDRVPPAAAPTQPRVSFDNGGEFINGIDHNYPGPDYDDLIAGVEARVSEPLARAPRGPQR